MFEVYLKKNEEREIVNGRCWVYANEVAKTDNKDNAKNGSLAVVYSNDGRYIGKGYINHTSKILVRIFIRDNKEDDKQFYLDAINRANDTRKNLGFDCAYRVVFGEADNLPALIVDKYADYLVIQCLSLGIDKRKKLICECLIDIFHPKGIYERSDVSVRLKEGLQGTKGLLYGEVPDSIEIEENGIKMLVDVKNGQKTGYFLDQKQNRFAARKYSCGDVLDCFCNSGGFSLNCAIKADKVTSCDISSLALQSVKDNAALNGFKNIETIEGDVFAVLRQFRKEGKSFDTVILDPPAFCKTADEVKSAYKGYKEINLSAMRIIKPYGYLITCSCSQHMTKYLFEKMLKEAAIDSKRQVKILEIKTQSQDHPSLIMEDESSYLKFYVLQVI